jgi:hypothetical protein
MEKKLFDCLKKSLSGHSPVHLVIKTGIRFQVESWTTLVHSTSRITYTTFPYQNAVVGIVQLPSSKLMYNERDILLLFFLVYGICGYEQHGRNLSSVCPFVVGPSPRSIHIRFVQTGAIARPKRCRLSVTSTTCHGNEQLPPSGFEMLVIIGLIFSANSPQTCALRLSRRSIF